LLVFGKALDELCKLQTLVIRSKRLFCHHIASEPPIRQSETRVRVQEFIDGHFDFFRRRKRLVCVYKLDGSRDHSDQRGACWLFVVLQRGLYVRAFKARFYGQL